jgi:hypothetical protein
MGLRRSRRALGVPGRRRRARPDPGPLALTPAVLALALRRLPGRLADLARPDGPPRSAPRYSRPGSAAGRPPAASAQQVVMNNPPASPVLRI